MKRIKILCVFIFLLVLQSCKDFKEVQYTGVKGFKVDKLDISGLEGDIMVGIKNPNSFGFSFYKSSFDVTYNGVNLGTAHLTKRVHINANGEETYPFKINSSFKNTSLTDVMKIMQSGSSGKIQIKGNLKAGKFLLRKKFPVDLKERVSLDQ